MIWPAKPLRIVSTYQPKNAGTGETYYVTEDGTHWRPALAIESSGQLTGSVDVRTVDRGYLWPR